jgi:signal transduction histidine kinase
MIIAGSNRGQIDAASAAIDAPTRRGRRTAPEPQPELATHPHVEARPTALRRLGAGIPRMRGRARTPRAPERAPPAEEHTPRTTERAPPAEEHTPRAPERAPRVERRGNRADRGLLRTEIPGSTLEVAIPLLLLALVVSAFIPGVRMELHAGGDQVAVETAATLISAFAALLFLDRFWRHLRQRDLLLAAGLVAISASNLGAGLLLADNLELAGHSVAWIVLGGRLLAWALIAAAVFAPNRVLVRPRPSTTRTVIRSTAALAALTVFAVLFGARPISPMLAHGQPLGNHTAMLIAQIVLVALTGACALALRREYRREGNPATRLLALTCAFACAAALANCAEPSFYASRVQIGDVLRLCWLVALFVCVCVEWSLDERRAPLHALARERRRMAADVHDLIMQDLSFALANARTLVDDPARAPQASTVVSAGERALAGARDVVSGLSEHDTRPIEQAVEASVRAAARHTPLTFDAKRPESCAELDKPTRDALVHIAREAVTNAVKHARPSALEVVLEHTGQWRLTVRDDGRGFDEAPLHAGFGLASMRQSAHALGGAVRVASATGEGTTVEAILP